MSEEGDEWGVHCTIILIDKKQNKYRKLSLKAP